MSATTMHTRWLRRAPSIGLALLLTVGSVPAGAQTATTAADRPVRRVEVTAAGGLMGGTTLGRASAAIRSPGQTPFVLFTTDSRIAPAPAVELRVGTALTRRFEVELRGAFLRS